MIRKACLMAYAIIALAVGMGSLLALVVFLSGLVGELSIDRGELRPIGLALAINSALMLLWTAQHIGMARHRFKQWISSSVPQPLERSTYVLCTGLALVLLIEYLLDLPSAPDASEIFRRLASSADQVELREAILSREGRRLVALCKATGGDRIDPAALGGESVAALWSARFVQPG